MLIHFFFKNGARYTVSSTDRFGFKADHARSKNATSSPLRDKIRREGIQVVRVISGVELHITSGVRIRVRVRVRVRG